MIILTWEDSLFLVPIGKGIGEPTTRKTENSGKNRILSKKRCCDMLLLAVTSILLKSSRLK